MYDVALMFAYQNAILNKRRVSNLVARRILVVVSPLNRLWICKRYCKVLRVLVTALSRGFNLALLCKRTLREKEIKDQIYINKQGK